MNQIDQELEAFFRATEAPLADEAFVWQAIETLERRTRARALALTAVRTAGAALFAMLALAMMTNAGAEAQAALGAGLRLLVALGALVAAIRYAARAVPVAAGLNLAAL
ncbi:MAG TPA: hypothetical protein VF727_04890 [Allosphingosinicella sp.]|jgi:hypothetical protein